MITSNEKKKNTFHFWRLMKRIIPMVFSIFPIPFILYCLLGILHGVSWAYGVFMNQNLYDTLSEVIYQGGKVSNAYWAAVLACLLIVGQEILNGIHNFYWGVFQEKAKGKLGVNIHSKVSQFPCDFFEDKDKLNDINKAQEGMEGAVLLFFCFAAVFNFYLPYLVFLYVYLYKIKPLLVLTILLIFIPALVSQILRTKIFSSLENESASLRRENMHFEKCLCSREYLKETRLLGGYNFFNNLFTRTIDTLFLKEWRAEKKNKIIGLGLNFVQLVGFLGVYYLLFISILNNDISVGVFAAVFFSVYRTYDMMKEVLGHIENGIMKNIGKVQNYLNFLDYKLPEGQKIEVDFTKGIKINNVTFTYPLATSPSLSDVSLEIKYGETLALVGENGSGKSTLVKLLIGLYKPVTGEVYIAGADVKIASDKSLFQRTSGVFQNYMTYALSLSENVRISDFGSSKDPREVLVASGIEYSNLSTFTNGLDTMLSREFDGTDLSKGQWQRIAIARGLYRTHDLIVLDEPTAAIDPIEETKVYKQFQELTEGVTSIIVTHRLGSARIANRIIVLDKGKIVEMGTHDILVKKGGKYAEMWKAQAKFYQ